MTSYPIDTTSYNKAAHYGVGHGYSVRPAVPTSIVVHSTEGSKGQSLEGAASYLYTSADVSAHYLIDKTGLIVQFLHPKTYAAWHAGGLQDNGTWTAQPAYDNTHSIGIECLHASGETWPAIQKNSLAWLLESLLRQYAIPSTMVETHGQIAIAGPYIRKKDPTNWPHADFIAWRDAQLASVPPYLRYQVVAPCSVLTARSPASPLASGPDGGLTTFLAGDQVNVGDVTDGWLWVSDSPSTPPGIGFIPSSYARPV